jgi:hypothetical protein
MENPPAPEAMNSQMLPAWPSATKLHAIYRSYIDHGPLKGAECQAAHQRQLAVAAHAKLLSARSSPVAA